MIQLNFHPFPELTTERLLLRRITMNDAGQLLFMRSDERVMEFIDKERMKVVEEAQAFIMKIDNDIEANEVIQWAITLKENPERLIGTICLWHIRKEHARGEIGYALHPDFWKKGIMKEAILKVIDYGFSVMKLHSIDANINPGNAGSAAILESVGFVREAYFKEDFFFRGKFLDTVIYSLLEPTSR
ncbi:MAG: GNAT family protein [Chitinophagaceae bacterium]